MGEAHSLRSQAIQVRGRDMRISIRPDVPPTLIVRNDKDDIWSSRVGLRKASSEASGQRAVPGDLGESCSAIITCSSDGKIVDLFYKTSTIGM